MTILFSLLWCLILSVVKIQKARQMFSSVLAYERQNVKYSRGGILQGNVLLWLFFGLRVIWSKLVCYRAYATRSNVPMGLKVSVDN